MLGAYARERRHDDSVGELNGPDLNRGEKHLNRIHNDCVGSELENNEIDLPENCAKIVSLWRNTEL